MEGKVKQAVGRYGGISALPPNVEIVLDARSQISLSFSESGVGMVKNSRVLGFDVSKFGDGQW